MTVRSPAAPGAAGDRALDAPGRAWQIYIDTGGTFTDCIATDPRGRTVRVKVLSSGVLRAKVIEQREGGSIIVDQRWDAPGEALVGWTVRSMGNGAVSRVRSFDAEASRMDLEPRLGVAAGDVLELGTGEEAPVVAARLATGTSAGLPLPPVAMRLATTRGTNALLERRGEPTALFVTRGFRDLLDIGNQQRSDLFTLRIQKRARLHARVVEVDERLAADGTVLRALDLVRLRHDAARALAEGMRSAAVALLHSWRNPDHEAAVAAVLRELGFEHVSCSSELSPLIKIVPRAETAVVNAYLAPVIDHYLAGVASAAAGSGSRLLVMTSSGGLVSAPAFRPKDALLSGPAGGVIGAAAAARRAGFDRVITFDMGGTSTDVARYDGRPEYVFEHAVGDAQIMAPAVAVESVAAGGGSICGLGPEGLFVGPQSAGASPGPACYGAGGPLTVTDVNLLLGRVDPVRFGIPVDPAAAERRLAELLDALERRDAVRPRREDVLEGLTEIADERMADAIRSVSVRRGYDPAEYALVAFGGAGGQHACGIADRLGIRTVIVPADAGLLSAAGLRAAAVERIAERQVLLPVDRVGDDLRGVVAELARDAETALRRDLPEASDVQKRTIVSLRYRGLEAGLPIDWADGLDLAGAFERRYREVYVHIPAGRPIEIESVRVVATPTKDGAGELPGHAAGQEIQPAARIVAQSAGRRQAAELCDRSNVRPGTVLNGPAVVADRYGTTVVRPGWHAVVDPAGAIILRAASSESRATVTPSGVRTELFTSRLREIAHETGEVLRRTSLSTNIKERLDFSCGVLDPRGELVVNAPHIPVHLGALGVCIRELQRTIEMKPGDVIVTNHPAFGGSHLPDVTVVTPVHTEAGELIGYVASRAHHAEIGGATPGSMPPAARSLLEEGVVIPPMRLLSGGHANWEALRRILLEAPHPTRAVEDNLADVAAAVAANGHGAAALRAMAASEGAEAVADAMRALGDAAERSVVAALRRRGDGVFEAEERLDDGTPLHVRIETSDGRAVVDFSGSGPVHPGNLNATPAIVRSAVMYVVRLLVGEPLPLNEGLMRAVLLRVPAGILNPPFSRDPAACPAVAGGNTETSQRIVDVLIKALGLAACSQGTMNSVLFGNAMFGYYETVCGGEGATGGHHGSSAVHTHMTNTRITDPELLEHRYPVRLDRFEIRRGSGGQGRWRGGDGVVRELTFLEDVTLSVVGEHRSAGPFGVQGGGPGRPAAQQVVRATGKIVRLGSVDGLRIEPGDRFVLETPGGGGFGAASEV